MSEQPMPQWGRELLASLVTIPHAAEVSATVARQYHRGVVQDSVSRHIRYFLDGHWDLAWYFYDQALKHWALEGNLE